MTQWEVYRIDVPGVGPHPVVVISSPSTCNNQSIKAVNALLCSSIRANDRVGIHEVALDQADGLDHLTGCQCHAFLLIGKQRFTVPLGMVSWNRREEIKRKIRAAFGI